MIEGIHRKTQRNIINSIGYGYVVLPYNVDRTDYVESAYRKEKVSILPDQGSSFIQDCYISRSALREIIFPDTVEGLGSGVVYVTNYFNNKPFIIGVISKEDESALFEEYGIMFTKRFNENKVTFEANAQRGEITINVSNQEDAASILLNCVGQEGTKFTINCNGTFYASVDNAINISSRQTLTFKSCNNTETNVSTVAIDNNNVVIRPNSRFNVGDGSEPLAKGDELVSQLNTTNDYLSSLVDAIQTALTTIDGTAGSVSAPTFMATVAALMPGNYSNVNSEISYTD